MARIKALDGKDVSDEVRSIFSEGKKGTRQKARRAGSDR